MADLNLYLGSDLHRRKIKHLCHLTVFTVLIASRAEGIRGREFSH